MQAIEYSGVQLAAIAGMSSKATAEAPEVLETVRDHEVVLERRLEDARRAAREHIASVSEEAERLRRKAERSIADALEAMRAEHARELASITQRSREEVEEQCREARKRFAERRESVVALVLRMLTGEQVP